MNDLFGDFSADYAPLATTGTNDTLDTAWEITEGTARVLGDGVEWYTFDAQAGIIDLTMVPIGALQTLNMELYNGNGQLIRANFTASGAEAVSYTASAADTYYVKVYAAQFGDNPPDDISFEFSLALDLPQVIAPDGNNSRATATELTEGSHDIIGREVDWFRFDSPAGTISLSMTAKELLDDSADPRDNIANLNMELYNSSGQLIRANLNPTGNEDISYLAAAAGTFYVKIYKAQYGDAAPEGTLLSYSLDLDLPEEVLADGNDSMATATLISDGTRSVSGVGVDWFKFDTLSGLMNFTLTPTSTSGAPLNLNMELFNAAGQSIRQNFSDGVENFSYLAGEDGTYFLKVYWAPFPNGSSSGVALTYDLTLDLPGEQATDGNDSFATADTITAGTHRLSGTGVDWYKFETLSGLMNFTLTQSGAAAPDAGMTEPLNLNMELFNAAGESIRQNFSDGTEDFNFIAGEDGTYYLKVYWAPYPDGAPNGVQMNYTLALNLPTADVPGPNDPGETMATATALGQGSKSFTGTGLDWFKLDTGPGMMTITMTPTATGGAEPLNLAMELYDASGEVIRTDFQESGAETVSFLSPGTGTYYLKIYWTPYPDDTPNGFRLTYDLDVDLPDNTWSKELDFGPIRNASVAVYDIDNDGKDEIFIGTSKKLDAQGNEVLPAGLIVLEDDGTIKWTKTFAAAPGVDPKTGKTYNTTSVTTAPTFSDVNGDGTIDLVVGVGADNRGEFDSVGQPGDMGGVYAVDANGNTLWYVQTRDAFGDDGRPDGVYGAPLVYDIDADGVREVIFEAWDHYLYIVDGRSGKIEREVNLHDTAGATPAVADLNNDGLYELVVPADITNNDDAGLPDQGGILHVLSNYGTANIEGWMDQVADTTQADFRGKFEPQSLWSSAKIVDLDRDGEVEIVLGTGNFFQDANGQYIKVWNADGTLRYQLNTIGRTLASPLIADLDGNGTNEIVAATIAGYVYAWNASGQLLFSTQVDPYTLAGEMDESGLPIVRQPIAVDIDNADGDLEILLSIGSQMIVLDSDGTQLTSTDYAEYVFSTYAGSPVARDIDRDGQLDLITGGTTEDHGQAAVYRWENVDVVVSDSYRTAAYQDNQSLHNIEDFVDRFYSTILGRAADPAGRNDWVDELYTGVQAGADVARGFINSREFTNRNTTDAEYVNVLYSAFFGRAADAGGFNGWMTQLENGASRADVLNGFIGSREFTNLANSYGIQTDKAYGAYLDAAVIVGDASDTNILRGGAGNNVIYDEGTQVEETGLSEKDISGQVYRLYGATLNRSPDDSGFLSWFNGINEGRITVEQAAGAFVGSREFQNTYGELSNSAFVQLLYQNVLGRPADAAGLASWVGQLDSGVARANVVLGFSDSREFQNRTNAGLDNFMRMVQPLWVDILEGGAGNDTMNGGTGADVFVFRQGQGGSDVIHGFEPWDELQLSGFGYSEDSDALSHMVQSGGNVVFNDQGQAITFLNTTLAEMNRVRYNLS